VTTALLECFLGGANTSPGLLERALSAMGERTPRGQPGQRRATPPAREGLAGRGRLATTAFTVAVGSIEAICSRQREDEPLDLGEQP
jgi:hypothetical protein